MLRFRRAVFCYYILHFDPRLHTWLMSLSCPIRFDGLLAIDSTNRQHVAKWLTDLFSKKVDFETIFHILTGDAFYERNKDVVANLEREAGKKVTQLWDTDPIFAKYPHLRALGRNKEFEEKIWPALKAAAKSKQK